MRVRENVESIAFYAAAGAASRAPGDSEARGAHASRASASARHSADHSDHSSVAGHSDHHSAAGHSDHRSDHHSDRHAPSSPRHSYACSEAAVASSRLLDHVRASAAQIVAKRGFAVWRNSCEYSALLLPGLVLAPRYFAGALDFGAVGQAGGAFAALRNVGCVLVDGYDALAGFSATCSRLHALDEAMLALSKLDRPAEHLPADSSGPVAGLRPLLSARAVDVRIPSSDGALLVASLQLSMARGDKLLIMGPSGVGKSAVLRVLAGLWRTSGSVGHAPSSFFLPQKPCAAATARSPSFGDSPLVRHPVPA